MESENQLKRKYKSIPITVKLDSLQRIDDKESTFYGIAEEIGVDHTTVRNWQKNKEKLKEWLERFGECSKESKRMRTVNNEHTDKNLDEIKNVDKPKKKYKSIPLEVKINAVQRIHNKESTFYEIAEKVGVDHTTVRLWEKNEEQLKEWLKRFGEGSKKSKRMRKAKHQYIDDALWLWCEEQHAAGVVLTGPILKEKAKMYYDQLGASENFSASNGWLRCFKDRHGLKCKKTCEEQLTANQEDVPKFKQKILDFIRTENLNHHQIFNCDETGLNYKHLPKSTLSLKEERDPLDMEDRIERLTVMACSNASGTCKLPLVVIGKEAEPSRVKNIDVPVSYKNQTSAWMTSDLFASWYETEFIPFVKAFLQESNLPSKALLLIDTTFSHSKVTDKDGILVKFFPQTETSLIQPMEQGCFQRLKLLYKEKLMKHIIQCINDKMFLYDAIQKINLRTAIFWLADVWNKLDVFTIQKSWNQVLPAEYHTDVCDTSSQTSSQSEMEPLLIQFSDLLQNTLQYKDITIPQLKEWLIQPYLMTADECLTDIEILQITTEETTIKVDDNYVNIDENVVEPVIEWEELNHSTLTKKEADLCYRHLLDFCQDNNYPSNIITTLNHVKEEIDKHHLHIYGDKS